MLVTGGTGFIGSHMLERLIALGADVLNIDRRTPCARLGQFEQIDIRDEAALTQAVRRFAPEYVVHLAARTDTDADDLTAYTDNTDGTRSLLRAVMGQESLKRLILTSTQFVVLPGRLPRNDVDFEPHTAYGMSKVVSEELLRAAQGSFEWTITRPTNVWGPRHPRYAQEFWAVMSHGLYMHPATPPPVRTYGYVRNVVWQSTEILTAPGALVDRQVYYLGDSPIVLTEWVDAFSRALRNRPARRVPERAIVALGKLGDGFQRVGLSFPLTSSRVASMTQDYPTPVHKTLDAFGQPPISLQDGVTETVRWLRTSDDAEALAFRRLRWTQVVLRQAG